MNHFGQSSEVHIKELIHFCANPGRIEHSKTFLKNKAFFEGNAYFLT